MAAKKTTKTLHTVAKQKDGTVQITLTIEWNTIDTTREETIRELSTSVEVPGFRKGKAPIEKARERLDSQFVLEKTLSKLLPERFSNAIQEEKLRPAMYPKFELISAKEGEDWQVRATTAEIPDFELGKYDEIIKNNTQQIWTPDKGDPKKQENLTAEQKENMAIKALEEHYKFDIPGVLIDEEVNSRLSSLLERIEKLGLSLESYLASIKKTTDELRAEYRAQAEAAIRLDIVLGAIAEAEKISIDENEINEFMKIANTSSPETPLNSDQKSTITSFLLKRKVLDKLASLIA